MKNFFLIIIIILFTNHAYSYDLFDTQFYNVEFTSKNIEDDKIEEIKKIKKNSLLSIFNNTLADNDFNELNQFLNEDLINTLIQNIIINDEKIINNKYKSKIKVNYNKKKIIEFYRIKKIPYIEYYPDKFLLIIYEKNSLHNNLFTKNNNYYEFFQNKLKNNNFFRIPNLDINDRFILNENDILNRDSEKLNKFYNKYQSNENLIVIIKNYKNKKIYDLILFSNGNILEKKSLSSPKEINIFFKLLEKETLNLWKQLNQIQNKFLNTLNCRVNYFNMLELKEIRNNLKNVSVINDLNKNKISYRNIEYEIIYYGNLKILFKIIESNNLKINFIDNKCIIGLV